jgi:hypothetical protein
MHARERCRDVLLELFLAGVVGEGEVGGGEVGVELVLVRFLDGLEAVHVKHADVFGEAVHLREREDAGPADARRNHDHDRERQQELVHHGQAVKPFHLCLPLARRAADEFDGPL